MSATNTPAQDGARGWSKRSAAGVWPEVAGIAGLVIATVYFLAVSWRKWNHPLIDFGRELYTPWRLSEGAVLYRDVDDVYGPLSQYFNAALFKLLGPGLMVLVTANLVVFAAILALAYVLFRRAWGVVGALGACFAFVSVFAFSQFIGIANFNYAAPYAHEATHGLLVSLALVAVLGRWVTQPSHATSFAAGLLAGLALVLKPEFIFAAGAVTAAAWLLRGREAREWPGAGLALWALGAVLPTAAFAVYFSRHFPRGEALAAAGRAWSSLFEHADILTRQYQLTFIGLDRPWENLQEHMGRTLLALAVLSALGGVVALALRRPNALARGSLLVVAMVAAMAISLNTAWDRIGRCLLGLVLLWLARAGWRHARRAGPDAARDRATHARRILLGTLAAAMMARMFLNGRIVQFGFFQAALAAMVVVAVACAESAEWMPAVRGRRLAVALVAGALFVPGMIFSARFSARFFRLETFAVGEGRDRFYYFTPALEPTGRLLNQVVEALRPYPPQATLLTLPEGGMVNYLARRPSPLPQFQFYSFTTEGGRERDIVAALAAHPPDLVVVISRGLHDFGIARYGERDGAGKQIIAWLEAHYRVVRRFGDDPLDGNQRGACILERLPAGGAKP